MHVGSGGGPAATSAVASALDRARGLDREHRVAVGDGFEGGCFVFDQRIALDARLRPVAAHTAGGQGGGA